MRKQKQKKNDNEVESYKKGLTVLKEIGKELGFE